MSETESHLKAKSNMYDQVQMRTFTNWVNSRLKSIGLPKAENLVEEIKDGALLHDLLKAMRKSPPSIKKNAGLKIVQMENLSKLFKYLKEDLKVVLVNIGPEDLFEKNDKLILGLIWTLIIGLSSTDEHSADLKKTVLEWAKKVTKGYKNVNVTNFKTSFKDGLAFNAILDFFNEDRFDYDAMNSENKRENFENAFKVAEECGIDTLLDLDDVCTYDWIDEKCIFTYVLEYYLTFKDREGGIRSKKALIDILNTLNAKVGIENKLKANNEKVNQINNSLNADVFDINKLLAELIVKINAVKETFEQSKEVEQAGHVLFAELAAFAAENGLAKPDINAEKISANPLDTEITGEIEAFNSVIAREEEELCEKKNSKENVSESNKVKFKDGKLVESNSAMTKSECKEAFEIFESDELNVEEKLGKKYNNLPSLLNIQEVLRHLKE